MDNAKIHKVESVRRVCSQFGCSLVFLSPYSFMLNPVENIFSKVKCFVRNQLVMAGENQRLVDIMKDGVLTVTDNDLNGYFNHMANNIHESLLRTSF
jgi:DDE superfamily endonuclease